MDFFFFVDLLSCMLIIVILLFVGFSSLTLQFHTTKSHNFWVCFVVAFSILIVIVVFRSLLMLFFILHVRCSLFCLHFGQSYHIEIWFLVIYWVFPLFLFIVLSITFYSLFDTPLEYIYLFVKIFFFFAKIEFRVNILWFFTLILWIFITKSMNVYLCLFAAMKNDSEASFSSNPSDSWKWILLSYVIVTMISWCKPRIKTWDVESKRNPISFND